MAHVCLSHGSYEYRSVVLNTCNGASCCSSSRWRRILWIHFRSTIPKSCHTHMQARRSAAALARAYLREWIVVNIFVWHGSYEPCRMHQRAMWYACFNHGMCMDVSTYTYDGTSQVTVPNKNIHIDLYECTLFVQIIYIHAGHMITYTYCVKSLVRWHVTGTVSNNNIYVKCIYKQIRYIFTHIIVRVRAVCVCAATRTCIYDICIHSWGIHIFTCNWFSYTHVFICLYLISIYTHIHVCVLHLRP